MERWFDFVFKFTFPINRKTTVSRSYGWGYLTQSIQDTYRTHFDQKKNQRSWAGAHLGTADIFILSLHFHTSNSANFIFIFNIVSEARQSGWVSLKML